MILSHAVRKDEYGITAKFLDDSSGLSIISAGFGQMTSPRVTVFPAAIPRSFFPNQNLRLSQGQNRFPPVVGTEMGFYFIAPFLLSELLFRGKAPGFSLSEGIRVQKSPPSRKRGANQFELGKTGRICDETIGKVMRINDSNCKSFRRVNQRVKTFDQFAIMSEFLAQQTHRVSYTIGLKIGLRSPSGTLNIK